jgi:hypothetical protein
MLDFGTPSKSSEAKMAAKIYLNSIIACFFRQGKVLLAACLLWASSLIDLGAHFAPLGPHPTDT